MVRTKIAKVFIWNTQSTVNQEGKGNHDTTTDNEW
ncbi:Uncharacterised protein [Streptococcus pneumoniae]|nr:Uncharacterised protein [Streptococcus pneumoniae]